MILLTDFDQQLQGLSTGSPPPPPPTTTSLADFFFFSLSSPNREPVHRLEFIMQIGQLQEKFC